MGLSTGCRSVLEMWLIAFTKVRLGLTQVERDKERNPKMEAVVLNNPIPE
jgi:hypothetical protein